jgi:hypothetical protein
MDKYFLPLPLPFPTPVFLCCFSYLFIVDNVYDLISEIFGEYSVGYLGCFLYAVEFTLVFDGQHRGHERARVHHVKACLAHGLVPVLQKVTFELFFRK